MVEKDGNVTIDKESKMSWAKRYWNYLRTWRRHRETVKALNRLSDKELDDIGLTREQIDSMIWLEADKQERKANG